MEALRGFEPHPPLGGPTVRSPHGHSTGASTGDRTRISEVAPRNSPIEPSTQNTTWTTKKSAVTRGARTAINSLLTFRTEAVRRPRPNAEARSEERAEPTSVGEHDPWKSPKGDAPQGRNEGGRDAAASGRRPLEVPEEGREKINGLLGWM